MNVEYFKIEKNVPFTGRETGLYTKILRATQEGDSFLMPKAASMGLKAAAKRLGYKIATRAVDDQTRRAWVLRVGTSKAA